MKEPVAEISQIRLGSARASRAAWGASPQACTNGFHHTVGSIDAETVGEAPTETREGACAPRALRNIRVRANAVSQWRNRFVVASISPSFAASIVIGALTLLTGCDRNASTESQPPPVAGSTVSNVQARATAASGPVGADAAQMVQIAAGQFMMGDKNEVDAASHEIVVSPFYMDKHLVTQEHFQKIMGSNPSRWKGDRNPVEQVRWSDAVRFCNKRAELDGLKPCYDTNSWQCNFDANGYRLPTEAEWEYACRAGTTTAYFFGDAPAKLGDHAWFDKNSGGRPHPVGQKLPNPWGLYDMSGNVWQWCNDYYQVDYYQESPKQDPRGPATGENKVLRGGAWRFGAESARSGYRYNENPGYADVCFGYDIYGFRCVRKSPGNSAH